MIQIHVLRDAKNQVQRFTISGHALFDQHGRDIVCAASSMLSLSIINGIEEVVKQKVHHDIDLEKGWLECRLPSEIDDEKMKYIQVLLETMVINLKELAKDYPKNVRMVEEEV